MHFQGKWFNFFLKNEALRSKSVKSNKRSGIIKFINVIVANNLIKNINEF